MDLLTRLLVRLYPSHVRARYGDEIRDVLARRARNVRATRGRLAAARYRAFQSWDLVLAALRERRAAGSMPGNGLDHDLRLALRRVRRSPGFTSVVVLALALGIGGTTAIFALIDAVVLKPLPYPDQERLVFVGVGTPESSLMPLTAGAVRTLADQTGVFASFGAFSRGEVAVQWPDGPREHPAVRITDGVLPTLGVAPILGRGFDRVDLASGSPLVALVDHGFWNRALGGAEDVVGRALRLEGNSVTVVGVLPEGFRFLDAPADLYFPLRLDDTDAAVLSFDYAGIARTAEGASPSALAERVSALLPASGERFGWIEPDRLQAWGMRGVVRPLKKVVVGDAGSFLWLLFGSVGVVLLIACADVANLFLIRAQDRQHEIAARIALGASRARVRRGMLVEGLVLALLGGLLGATLAYLGTGWLLSLVPGQLPRASEISLDPRVALFTLAVSLGVGAALALLADLGVGGGTRSLRDGDRTSTDSRVARVLRDGLAAGAIALAVVLLIGSGLMVRSFVRLRGVEPGVTEPERVLTFQVAFPRAETRDVDAAIELYRRIHDRLAALPGAAAVGAASRAPTTGGNQSAVHTQDDPDAAEPTPVVRKAVLGDYFVASGIPLLAGRDLEWADAAERRPVGLASESLALRLWGSPANALGKRVRHAPGDAWREIVGVVGDVHEDGLTRNAPPVVYWPVAVRDFHGFAELLQRQLSFTIRGAGTHPMELLGPARDAVWAEMPTVPIADPATLAALVRGSIARTSFVLVALGVAAAVATLLGAIGIYGVISYVFARRRRELGIRMALGARARDIRGLILGHAARLAGAGLLVGLPSAALSSGLLRGYLFGVATTDAASYLLGAGLVVAIAILACVVPIRRATALQPVETLSVD